MNKGLAVTNLIKDKIHTIRGMQIILDKDLAEMYEVETRALKQAVNRNKNKFPGDFMFKLNKQEVDFMLSQSVIPSKMHLGGASPYAFTEHGVSMLSSVLNSNKSIEINIKIIREFIAMRKFISKNAELFIRLDKVDNKLVEHDKKFDKVFDALDLKDPEQGVFFDGQIFDAYHFVSNLIRKAKKRIILIDNYIDDSVLILFSKNNIEITIYTKINKRLLLDVEKFNSQYKKIILKDFHKSHDRFLIIDNCIYPLGASLKDLGKKWFAFSKLSKKSFGLLEKLKLS
jgi:hypothetical protein